MYTNSLKAEFLNLNTMEFGLSSLVESHTVYCKISSSISGLYLREASNISLPSCVKWKCLQALPDVTGETQPLLTEKQNFKVSSDLHLPAFYLLPKDYNTNNGKSQTKQKKLWIWGRYYDKK